jgi:hypothetical protein
MRHMIALSSLLAALALGASQAGAQAQTSPGQSGKFCLTGGEPATKTCTYDTMAACNAAKQGPAQQCIENTPTPAAGTGMAPAKK